MVKREGEPVAKTQEVERSQWFFDLQEGLETIGFNERQAQEAANNFWYFFVGAGIEPEVVRDSNVAGLKFPLEPTRSSSPEGILVLLRERRELRARTLYGQDSLRWTGETDFVFSGVTIFCANNIHFSLQWDPREKKVVSRIRDMNRGY